MLVPCAGHIVSFWARVNIVSHRTKYSYRMNQHWIQRRPLAFFWASFVGRWAGIATPTWQPCQWRHSFLEWLGVVWNFLVDCKHRLYNTLWSSIEPLWINTWTKELILRLYIRAKLYRTVGKCLSTRLLAGRFSSIITPRRLLGRIREWELHRLVTSLFGSIFRSTPLSRPNNVDVDVVKLRAQANASMPASYNSNIQLLILILISNNSSDFRFHEFRL